MELTVNSRAGSGDNKCLNVNFTSDLNSFICMADVVSNLVGSPNIQLKRDGIEVNSTAGLMLTYPSANEAGMFTCIVCINVSDADIQDHCNESNNISISKQGI